MKRSNAPNLVTLIPNHLNPTSKEDETILLTMDEVTDRLNLSRSTIYRMMNEGIFPRPKRLGTKTVRWSQKDLVNWLRSKNQGE